MELLEREALAGMKGLEYYSAFQEEVESIKNEFLSFLLEAKASGKKVIGYGAAAKGNTLLNYAGVKGSDLIEFVVDASPHKQNKYLPGSRILVVPPSKIEDFKPDLIIIFPWNLTNEIKAQLAFAEEWGAKFVTFIPNFRFV